MTYRRKGRQERGSTRAVLTRISEEEYEEWKRRAEMLGITLSEYIRSTIRKSKTEVILNQKVEIKPLVEIASQYGKIGSNINQIAHHLNSGEEWSDQLRESLEETLTELRAEVKIMAKVVDEINGYHKTQGTQKFKL